jgi:hypothetical protein
MSVNLNGCGNWLLMCYKREGRETTNGGDMMGKYKVVYIGPDLLASEMSEALNCIDGELVALTKKSQSSYVAVFKDVK